MYTNVHSLYFTIAHIFLILYGGLFSSRSDDGLPSVKQDILTAWISLHNKRPLQSSKIQNPNVYVSYKRNIYILYNILT